MSRVGRVQINRPGDTGPVTPPTPPDDPPPVGYLAAIVADGAVAAWPLTEHDGSGTYADVIGGLDATLDTGSTGDWASTPIGPSLDHSPHFIGSGSVSSAPDDISIVTAHDVLFEVGTGDFAMEAWVMHDVFPGGSSNHAPITLAAPDLSNYMISSLVAAGAPGAYLMADTANVSATSPATYDDQGVHHCVFTRRTGSYFVIIDGVEVATATPSTPVSYATTEVIQIAGLQWTSPGVHLYALHGQIAWCAWYTVGLTAEQAAAHYAFV